MNYPEEVSLINRPAKSLSGKYILVISEKDEKQEYLQTFKILGQDKKDIYTNEEWFDTRHTTFFLWDMEDRVWVYSGDMGTYFWEYNKTSASWQRHTYANSNVSAPDFLKKVRPKWHKK